MNNIFFGTMQHLLIGVIHFRDEKNNITAQFEFEPKRKPLDMINGWIKKGDKQVSTIRGNYMGFLNFDDERFWDLRESKLFDWKLKPDSLESDAYKRIDTIALFEKEVERAQTNKETLENLQRWDRKLRNEATERRKKGGSKFKSIPDSIFRPKEE